MKKRDCYAELQKYLNHPRTNRVFSFCGLRRTGKTTMVAQAIHDMDPVGFSKSCFIAANKYNSMEELDADLNSLGKQGYKYFFIDEITALPDFIRKSAWLSDIYGWMGKRLVLTGTDSLSFILAGAEHLYDRQERVHTSHIPFHEFSRITGEKDIDKYIEYGGTLVPESPDGNPDFSKSPFATTVAMGEYLDTAISGNILHSLRHDDSIRNERNPLRELDKEGRLQNIINRVVAYYNSHLMLEHLTEAIDLPLPNMHPVYDLFDRKSHPHPIDEAGVNKFDSIKTMPEPLKTITQDYLNSLHITESVGKGISKEQMNEIERFLGDIGLLRKVMLETVIVKKNQVGERELDDAYVRDNLVVIQPGMQYCIANSLVNTMTKNATELIKALNHYRRITNNKILTEANLMNIKQRILNMAKGNILENIVLIEAADAVEIINSNNRRTYLVDTVRAYKLRFIVKNYESLETGGNKVNTNCINKEVDLVVGDSRNESSGYEYRLFEVKHSDKVSEKQYEHLVDPDLCSSIEDYFGGKVVQRTVLYRGPSMALDNGVIYYNVEDFLCKLGEDPNFLVCDLKAEIQKEQQEKAEQEACIDDPDEGTDWCER